MEPARDPWPSIRRAALAAVLVAPSAGVTASWLWVLWLGFSNEADHAAWRRAVVVLAAFSLWGLVSFLIELSLAARLVGGPVRFGWARFAQVLALGMGAGVLLMRLLQPA